MFFIERVSLEIHKLTYRKNCLDLTQCLDTIWSNLTPNLSRWSPIHVWQKSFLRYLGKTIMVERGCFYLNLGWPQDQTQSFSAKNITTKAKKWQCKLFQEDDITNVGAIKIKLTKGAQQSFSYYCQYLTL